MYIKTKLNIAHRIDAKVVNDKQDYLKCTSKPSYILRKIFNNNLVAIRKSEVSLKHNEPWNVHIRFKYSINVQIAL